MICVARRSAGYFLRARARARAQELASLDDISQTSLELGPAGQTRRADFRGNWGETSEARVNSARVGWGNKTALFMGCIDIIDCRYNRAHAREVIKE